MSTRPQSRQHWSHRHRLAHHTPLLLDWRGHWLSPLEYSQVLGRPVKTVWRWLYTGHLDGFNVPNFRDSHGRIWILNTLPSSPVIPLPLV